MATKTKTTNLHQALWAEFKRDYGPTAEQWEPAFCSVRKRSDGVWLTRNLLSGKARLKHPENGSPIKMSGDIARIGPVAETIIFAVLWREPMAGRSEWIPLPSMDALMEWTMDSVCPTPDGRILEPDHPDSWLRILGLV